MTCDVSNNRLFDITDGDHEKSAVKPKVPAGITKTFRSYDQDQMFLLPRHLTSGSQMTTAQDSSLKWQRSFSIWTGSIPPFGTVIAGDLMSHGAF